jgi:prolyl oligopeptidase
MLPPLRRTFVLGLAAFAACSSATQAPPTTTPPTATPTAAPGQAAAAAAAKPTRAWQPPPTATVEQIDDYHGEKIADPYRWLEDQDSPAVAKWVAVQNAATQKQFASMPARSALRSRLQELWNYPRFGLPQHAGDRWLYSKNDGLQNQSVYYLTGDPEKPGSVLLDPNLLSADGTVALAGVEPDEDGRLLAYATAARGSDWREWHVLDLVTGKARTDSLQWSKFSGATWTHDGAGFFYLRYAAPQPGQELKAANKNPQLCYHKVGDEQSKDRIVYERPDQPDWSFSPKVSDDGRFAVIALTAGTDRKNRVACIDLQQEDWPVAPLLMEGDAGYAFLGNDGDQFYFRTDKGAEHRCIVALDRTAPEKPLRTLVAERTDTLQGATLIGERFVCQYLADAASALRLYRLDGTADGEIALPQLGTVGGISGRRRDHALYFGFSSPLLPPSVLRYDIDKRELTTHQAPKVDFDFAPYVTERVFPQSKDGERLCLFITRRRDMLYNGNHPTQLYGYGGFDISTTPTFAIPNLAWLEQGGVLATAVLRGGGEYGSAWHQAGMLSHKQNVFDDFCACAEYLERNGYCTARKLAIYGGSNGGLLVGACLVQHPELFGAAVPAVGVLDMLRYHLFTIGAAWAPEYGRADDKLQFAFLRAYSPLHNIAPGGNYPPTLVMTGDHDDRVLPGHSFKFAAALQQAQGGEAPILLRIETDAGHGAGKPISKQLDESADRLAFMLWALNR